MKTRENQQPPQRYSREQGASPINSLHAALADLRSLISAEDNEDVVPVSAKPFQRGERQRSESQRSPQSKKSSYFIADPESATLARREDLSESIERVPLPPSGRAPRNRPYRSAREGHAQDSEVSESTSTSDSSIGPNWSYRLNLARPSPETDVDRKPHIQTAAEYVQLRPAAEVTPQNSSGSPLASSTDRDSSLGSKETPVIGERGVSPVAAGSGLRAVRPTSARATPTTGPLVPSARPVSRANTSYTYIGGAQSASSVHEYIILLSAAESRSRTMIVSNEQALRAHLGVQEQDDRDRSLAVQVEREKLTSSRSQSQKFMLEEVDRARMRREREEFLRNLEVEYYAQCAAKAAAPPPPSDTEEELRELKGRLRCLRSRLHCTS
eukprot:TRINITY_DN7422_c0_g1_i1.p1 TRINITY_DN7422_c0_g1~~TRINITY_DN7422_c0_g1_i1.p1  ORF type:complete len:401 (+),score=40.66 TRINITY_DN7422_c0_g1_i1:53-1204(+)